MTRGVVVGLAFSSTNVGKTKSDRGVRSAMLSEVPPVSYPARKSRGQRKLRPLRAMWPPTIEFLRPGSATIRLPRWRDSCQHRSSPEFRSSLSRQGSNKKKCRDSTAREPIDIAPQNATRGGLRAIRLTRLLSRPCSSDFFGIQLARYHEKLSATIYAPPDIRETCFAPVHEI